MLHGLLWHHTRLLGHHGVLWLQKLTTWSHILWLVVVHDGLDLRLLHHAFQRIDKGWIPEILSEDVLVHGPHSAVFNEVLHLKEVEALSLHLL